MCVEIIDKIGGVDFTISTPNEFKEHFGFEPTIHPSYANADLSSQVCSCPMDIEASLKSAVIQYEMDGTDCRIKPLKSGYSSFLEKTEVGQYLLICQSFLPDNKNKAFLQLERRIQFLKKRYQYLTQ